MARRIGELLVDAGAVSEVDLRQALLQQKKQGGRPRLGELLLSLKKVAPVALARALADQCSLTYTELPAEIPQALSRRLTLDFQKKHQVLAFRKDVVSGVDQIHVAIADPTQKEVLDQIQGKFREVLRFYVATPGDVVAGIERAAKAPAAPPAGPAVAALVPAAATAADPLDDLFGGGGAPAAPSAGDPLDDLFGGAPSDPASSGVDPLDDLLGGTPAPAAADPLDDLLGGAPGESSPALVAAAGDLFDDLLGDGSPAAPAAAGGDPLDDLLGDAAPAAPGGAEPLDGLLGAPAAEASGPQTPHAYVHVYSPRPKPPPPPAQPAPAADGPTENEVTPPSGTAFDEVPPDTAAAEPSLSDEDAWLLQELNRLASGDPPQADALTTVASVIRMLVRKGVVQQDALIGELGR